MGRKKYFAALAAAGMIGAMALGSAFNSYAADGWTKSNDHWTCLLYTSSTKRPSVFHQKDLLSYLSSSAFLTYI